MSNIIKILYFFEYFIKILTASNQIENILNKSANNLDNSKSFINANANASQNIPTVPKTPIQNNSTLPSVKDKFQQSGAVIPIKSIKTHNLKKNQFSYNIIL